MSIHFSLKVKDTSMNEKMLVAEISNLGMSLDLNYNSEEDIVDFNSTYDIYGFDITFVKNECPPFNEYETLFLQNNFKYNQSVLFGINKEGDFREIYSKMLELIFNLMSKINTNALLTSSVHDDICYFENGKSIYIKSTISFSDIIEHYAKIHGQWNCFYKQS
ncbi:MAG: hypothetical protein H7Y18_10260 [Clostridiaceae bacterium]|nr:hypothetical protein [Clostridiaceae bacterium]